MGTREGINKEVRKESGRKKTMRRMRTRHMPTREHTPKSEREKEKRPNSRELMEDYLQEVEDEYVDSLLRDFEEGTL